MAPETRCESLIRQLYPLTSAFVHYYQSAVEFGARRQNYPWLAKFAPLFVLLGLGEIEAADRRCTQHYTGDAAYSSQKNDRDHVI